MLRRLQQRFAKLPSAAQLTLSDKDDVKNLKTYYDNPEFLSAVKDRYRYFEKYQELLAQMEKLAGKDWYKKYFIIDRYNNRYKTDTDTKQIRQQEQIQQQTQRQIQIKPDI